MKYSNPDAVLPHDNNLLSPFVADLVPVISAQAQFGMITYLDYEFDDKPTDGINSISLAVRTKAFDIPLRCVVSTLPAEAGKDLESLFGVDAKSELATAMFKEIKSAIELEVLEAIKTNSSEMPAKRKNLARRLLDRWFKLDLSPVVNEKTITQKILMASNMVATGGRRGPANFAVVGRNLGALLMDNPAFHISTDASGHHNLTGTIRLGTIAGLTIYSSNHLGNTEFIVGRKGYVDEPGIKLVFGDGGEHKLESIEWFGAGGHETKHKLCVRVKPVDVGDVSKMYKRMRVRVGEKPWWEKILGV